MPDDVTVKEKIRQLEEKYADEIKEAQSQPGLRDFMKISEGARRYRPSAYVGAKETRGRT